MNAPVEVLGPALIVRGPALASLYFCVVKGISAARLSGYDTAAFAELQQSIRTAHNAHVSQLRHGDVAELPDESQFGGYDEDDRLTVDQAAAVLGVTARTVQRLALKFWLGSRAGGKGTTWVLSRSLVMAHKEFRDQRDEEQT